MMTEDMFETEAAPAAKPAADAPEVIIYCDGACSPNPGIGGWGAVLLMPGKEEARRELCGAAAESTNNRMEITAAMEGLRALKKPCRVSIFTDSEYLQKAFTAGWIKKWQRNGWRTAAKKPVLNQDLWVALMEAMKPHAVTWKWVRGHALNVENECCDRLAVEARKRLAKK